MTAVVLVRPETPGNIGFTARAMANFDQNELILVNPLCNHLEDDAERKAMHAKDILRRARIMDFEELRKKFDILAGTTSVLGTDYNIPRSPITIDEFSSRLNTMNTAIVFGNEGNGLSNHEIALCDLMVIVPSSRKYHSMNLSHAVAIVLYELYKHKGELELKSRLIPASGREKQVLMDKMLEIVDRLEFSTAEKKDTQRIVWKRIFEQSMMSKREAFAMIGLLRKIENGLKEDRHLGISHK